MKSGNLVDIIYSGIRHDSVRHNFLMYENRPLNNRKTNVVGSVALPLGEVKKDQILYFDYYEQSLFLWKVPFEGQEE